MKFSLAIVAAAAALVAAQDLSQLPNCAKSCAQQGMGAASNCKGTDIKCICGDTAFISSITSCVKGACDSSDEQKTVKFAVDLCKNAGVEIPQSVIDSLTKSAEPSASHHSSKPANTYPTPTSNEESSATEASATVSPTSSSVPSGAAGKVGVPGLGLGAAVAALFLL